MNPHQTKQEKDYFEKGDTAYIHLLGGYHKVTIQNVMYRLKMGGRLERQYIIKLYDDTEHEHTATEKDLYPEVVVKLLIKKSQ